MAALVVDVPLERLRPAAYADDSRFDVGDVRELAASIAAHGLLHPIGVRALEDSTFQLVYGHRRTAAVSSLGWTSVAATLLEDAKASDDLLKSLAENLQRRNLSRAERADALERLVLTGMTGKQIAERLGMSENVTWAWLKVGRSKPLLAALRADKIGIHEARQLASLPDDVIAALVPELWGKTEPWKMARIARAVDDHRTRPPNGSFKVHAETHVQRSLELILEHCRGVKTIRSQAEIDLVGQIIDVVRQWQRDLARARTTAPT